MDRFKPPTRAEEDRDSYLESVFELLTDKLGREPTDEEMLSYIESVTSDGDDYE